VAGTRSQIFQQRIFVVNGLVKTGARFNDRCRRSIQILSNPLDAGHTFGLSLYAGTSSPGGAPARVSPEAAVS
jgi:hypothetical protein